MVCSRGSGRSQLKSVSGAGRVRLCGHVKLSLLNSADYQEYPDRKVGARACATSSAYCGLCPRQPSIQKVRTKFIKKQFYTVTVGWRVILSDFSLYRLYSGGGDRVQSTGHVKRSDKILS